MTKAVKTIREKHRQELLDGAKITWKECTLSVAMMKQRSGITPEPFFKLFSPVTGLHTLCAASTDTERLAAHWRGFTATSQQRKMGENQ